MVSPYRYANCGTVSIGGARNADNVGKIGNFCEI